MTEIEDIGPLLDEELREVYRDLPPVVDAVEDPERARAFRDERFARLARAGSGAGPTGLDSHDEVIQNEGRELLVRVHRPLAAPGPLPAVIWLHGGGFTGGSVRYEDAVCTRLAGQVGAVVVAVEYRLLPEHPYPAAIEDAYAALCWASEQSDRLGVDPARLAVAGQSAGGTLAAGVALLTRDRGEIALACQMSISGAMDDRLDWPSAHRFADRRSPTRRHAVNQWRAYLGAVVDDPPPYAVPARAPSLSGLAPAYLMVGGLEISRDENVDYARALLAAGVPTELHLYPSAFHGFDVVAPGTTIAQDAQQDQVRALRRALRAGADARSEVR